MQTGKQSDDEIRNSVATQIDREPEVMSRDVSVAVRDGVAAKSVYGVKAVANDIEVKTALARTDSEIARDVTLEGKVDWNFQRSGAAARANRISGVCGVINVKSVAIPSDVKARIEEALKRSAEVDSRRITVTAEDGTVTLNGNVRSWRMPTVTRRFRRFCASV